MRKNQIYTLAMLSAVLLASSCDKAEEIGTPEIQPVTVGDIKVTKRPITYTNAGGTRLTDNAFEEGDRFAVWANYCTPTDTTEYITEQCATLTQNVWNTDKTYYWPAEGTIDFHAIYPLPSDNDLRKNKITFTHGTSPVLEYKINDISEDVDLMIAHSRDVDCLTPKPVPLHFKHLLSKMYITITNNCKFGIGLDVRIKSFCVSVNMHTEGHLDWKMMEFITQGEQTTFTHNLEDVYIKKEEVHPIGTYYFMPEQVGDLMVTTTWEILNNGVVADVCKVSKELPCDKALESGKITTINIVLSRKDTSNDEDAGEVTIN